MNVKYDDFMRTTQPRHHKCAQELWKRCAANGDIYLDKYEGWYDVREESYVTDAEAEASDFKDQYGSPLQKQSEESFFFRMSKYQQRLLDHIAANPGFIPPDNRKQEILSFLGEPLRDLCVSRTTFDWGVPVPDAPGHVMYVWFDALSNYLSGIGYLEDGSPTADLWPADFHIIGKGTQVDGRHVPKPAVQV